ncbi:aminoacyltransferase [Streptococcus sp. NLN76]|uniref:aminoacyltransferase n=1 Tax=Streptococcus sp. NLN76 TaxID=2822800 RepID=UPI0018AC8823|nr:aminoacyltransferase [Streptococcus sp. NLN76]MBF8970598.1 aminoacyltransferase [Streptococcus sp. NLN76]
MYTCKINSDLQEYDQFVSQHPQANLLQSSSWAIIKDNWKSERLIFLDQNETLVASALVLIRPLPLGLTMLYVPRGPIMDYQNQNLVTFVMKTLKKRAKEHKAIFAKIDPSLFLSKTLPDGSLEADPLTQTAIEHLETAGAKWTGPTQDISDTIQPRFHANIYKGYFGEEHLAKRTRQNIRTARNKGLEIVFGGEELLDAFSDLMKRTEDRKNISLRGKDYYQKLLTTYGNDAFITIAQLNLVERKKLLEKELHKKQEEAKKFDNNNQSNKSLQNQDDQKRLQSELDFLTQMQEIHGDLVAISGTLTLEYGPTAENIYAGMNDDFARYQAPLLTWYETALHSFNRGKKWHNMGGVENSLDGGLYNFKKNLSPVIEEFVGEFDLPTSTLYPVANLALKLRKKLRK